MKSGWLGSAAGLAIVVSILLSIALGAARRRAPDTVLLDRGPYASVDPDADYRRRLTTLALVQGRAPHADPYVDPAERSLARPPFVQGLVATLVAWTQSREGPLEFARYEEVDVERTARRLHLLFALSAALLAALFAHRTTHGDANAARRAALVAGGLAALSPLAVSTEHVDALHPHALLAFFTLALFSSCALAFRAAEAIDVVVGALGAGFFAGLSLAVGLESWPAVVVAGVVFALLALRGRADRRREASLAPIVFVAACVAMVSASEGRVVWRDLAPAFDGRVRGLLADPWRAAVFAAALWLPASLSIRAERRDPLRVLVFATTALSFVLWLFDPRFAALWHAGIVVLCAWTASRPWALLDRNWKRASWLGAPALLIVSLAWPVATVDQLERSDVERSALHAALAWLRDGTAAPGPFNHPDGAQDWRVLSAPRLAGPIAQRAHRPTLAIEYEHRGSASAREIAGWFAETDALELAALAQSRGARYLLVASSMLEDPALPAAARAPAGLLARFLERGAELRGWSRVFDSGPASADHASSRSLVCVWRVDSTDGSERAKSSLSPRSSR